MVVRPAEREDRPQLLELIKGYFAFYRTPFPAESKIETMLDLSPERTSTSDPPAAEAEGPRGVA